ncbi:hypothetical protein [Paracoccus sp. S3-43]|uniref:hypothetical protein n=1 Tax=Paracoccus sp. S3-43 TaxID=3030011 RepID=UPI0023B0F9FB|nr:hypothetical protein [Paracoccus sp. S3-43]WEF24214.1 hypothetical protein PXD02_15750 [Paracoccus sp. S3-43]
MQQLAEEGPLVHAMRMGQHQQPIRNSITAASSVPTRNAPAKASTPELIGPSRHRWVIMQGDRFHDLIAVPRQPLA